MKLTAMLFAIFLLGAPLISQGQTTAGTLPFVSILEFGDYGGGFLPSKAVLTPQEEKSFQDHVKKLQFPAYLFSGCRDRTHAAYLMLPAGLKDKVSKIWVIAPSKHSASVKGVVRLSPDVPGSIDVRWAYHVVLAYKTEGDLHVYDPCIAQGKVLAGAFWFAALRPDPLSFWTMTAGRIYAFSSTYAPGSANKEIWSGDAFEYTGAPAAGQWIPFGLARDAVGEAILKNRECEILKSEAKDADALLDRLKKGDVPQGCENLLDIFKIQKQSWIEKLKPLN